MNFRSNFDKFALIGSEPIKIYFENKTVTFVPPSVRMYFTDYDFVEFSILFKQNPKHFKREILLESFIVNNRYEALLAIIESKYKKEMIFKYLKKLFPNIEYLNGDLCFDGIPLLPEEYEILVDFYEASCLETDFTDFMRKIDINYQSQIEDEKTKEIQERLERAKKKNKKSEKNSGSKTITIDQIVIGILFEFQSLKIEDVYNMNLFTFFEFWKYISKITDYKIQVVAAGNGLIKEFTYFIN